MPKLHHKPTKEELEAGIKASQEKLEKLETPKKEPKPEPTPSEPVPESKEESKEEPKEPQDDYKKKFSESTREAQVLHAKNKKVNEAIDRAVALPEPTEEELKAEYANWDELDEFAQKMARDVVSSKKKMEVLAEATKEFKDIDAWNEKVDKFVDDPKVLVKHPELDGKEEEFKVFATKATRRGVDFEDLVSAFAYDISKQTKPKQKGQMFETGSGGPNEKPKPHDDTISPEEGRKLRTTDYKKWKEMLTAGKIRNE